MKIEAQVLRNMKAFTRPQVIDLNLDLAEQKRLLPTHEVEVFHDYIPQWFSLFPGYGMDQITQVTLTLKPTGLLTPDWMGFRTQLDIDNLPLGGLRPGAFYVQSTDIPSGLVHIPPVADDNHPTLGGWHTITFRTV